MTAGAGATSRLFVAAWPPPEVLDRLEGLPRPAEPGVRYTRREQWHVTLRFLGQAEEAPALAALGDVVAEGATAELGPRLARLGRDVVVVPVAGLDELAGAVRRASAHVGRPPDPRPFAGHITIARLRRRGACGVAGAPIAGSFAVSEVALVRSTLRPEGPTYETVAVRPLG